MKFLYGVLALTVVFHANVADSAPAARNNSLRLWYTQPAKEWSEALPVGNGHMGAMVFGGVPNERIQFNEDTLWRGKPHDYVRAGAGEQLAEIRRLIAEGRSDDAGRLARARFLSDPLRQLPYQPFGDLRFQFTGHEKAVNYRRELDLDSAVATTTYRAGDVEFKREVFASYPDKAIVMRITADKPGKVSFTLKMDSPHTNTQTLVTPISQPTGAFSQRLFGLFHRSKPANTNSGELLLTGKVQEDGLQFASLVRVSSSGGEVIPEKQALTIANADSATVVLVAATSFKNFQDISADPAERCEKLMQNAAKRKYDALLADHLEDHRTLFRRVDLDLGESNAMKLPTDERLRRIKTDGLESDPALAVLHFQYGRYLLIASSRPGSQPANLQGVWNELLDPPWEGKYTLNINCEMNYWPAELCNLSECHEPLFDMIDDLVISGGRTAKKQYNCRGWVVHHNTDLWRGTAPINNVDGIWPTGGAWLSHHLWEHYLFTGDKKFLEHRAYPVMKNASLFFVDFLVKDPETGYLVTSPSHSPEQSPPDRPLLTIGPTMDNQLVRALLNYTIEAAGILDTDEEFAAKLADIRKQLPPNRVGQHGQLQEWLKDWDAPDNNHRHMSPLFALYPGWEITPADPKIFEAARVLLKWRGNGSTGWSFAWRIPLWARVGDGDFAYSQFFGLLNRRTLPNLFDLCGPFQIDGNFGACAGVAEMLLQSHRTDRGQKAEDRRQNSEIRILDLLPALPKAWPTGSVRGLCARDGFEVDIEWKEGRLTKAVIHSKLGRPCRIRAGQKTVDFDTKKGKRYELDGQLRPAR